MKNVIIIYKRRRAVELKKRGWSNARIARYLGAGKNSIKKWLEMDGDEITADRRGWLKGRSKKYTALEKARVLKIRRRLKTSKGAQIGSKAISRMYRETYGTQISEWFINKTLREFKERKAVRKHREEWEFFPDYPLDRLKRIGKVVMSLEFIGARHYLRGDDSNIFLSCKYLHPHNAGTVSKAATYTCDEVLRVLSYMWRTYHLPDLVYMHYSPIFVGNLARRRFIGKLPIFLLNLGIIPFYSSMHRSGSGISLERFTDVFSEPFVSQLQFYSGKRRELTIRNMYMEYSDASSPDTVRMKIQGSCSGKATGNIDFKNRYVKDMKQSQIYFFQRVKEVERDSSSTLEGFVRILAQDIFLDGSLVGSAVLCQLDLKKKNSLSSGKAIGKGCCWSERRISGSVT